MRTFGSFALCSLVTTLGLVANADEPVDFQRDVRPILSRSCFNCHGNDEETREADLRLDMRLDAIANDAVVPGDSDASEIIARIISEDNDLRMPPTEHGEPLTPNEVSMLRRWIDAGAEYDVHWAFTKPQRVTLPEVSDEAWPRNGIDHFVMAKLDQQNMNPAERADRYTLIRRVYLDLIGLPPTPEQVDVFVNDNSDDAFEKVVDQLLASPRYGERWAQMWLDLARYADTMGYERDTPRTIWRYRDWVIDAFNQDMPFDQFTIEQLAGDLLPNATLDQRIATAMHRNTLTNQEAGTDDEEFRVAAVKDRVDTTMQVWMGLTMGCAKCHTHKYDPISHHDYYSFYAYFNQTADADRGDDFPTMPTPTLEQKKQLAQLDQMIAEFEASPSDEEGSKELEQLKKRRKRWKPTTTPVMQELAGDKRRVTKIQLRGNFLDPGETVEARVPESFGSFPADAPANRLGVARWLVDADNPLTARVQVNRVWARLFGQGIVLTEEDFGTQGFAPTHPELLDWIALKYANEGWSMKNLLRLIVTSATYQQASYHVDSSEVDPDNRWLTRGPRFRLEAEMVRDQALAAGGILSAKMHGPSVMPPQPPGIWKVTYSALKWKTSEGEDRHRRSLYTYWRRTSPYPSMLTFDAGTRETCVIRRVRTNTPLQALVTLNDPVYVEAAAGMASQMVEHASSDEQRAAYGFRLAAVRPPDETEVNRLLQVFGETRSHYRRNKQQAEKLIAFGRIEPPEGMPAEDLASWIVVGNVILNLDEVLTKP